MQKSYKTDYSGSDNASSLSGNIAFYQALKQLAKDDPRTILDIGSGIGYKTVILREIFPWAKVFSLEVNLRGEMGYSQYPVFGDALNLPFSPNTVDLAVCCEVLEHLEKPENAFAEINSVLRPGGYLVLSSPNYEFNLAGLTKKILGRETWNPWYGHQGKRENFTTASMIRSLLRKNEYRIRAEYGEFGESLLSAFFPPIWLLCKYLQGRSKRSEPKTYSPYRLLENVKKGKGLPIKTKMPGIKRLTLGYLVVAQRAAPESEKK